MRALPAAEPGVPDLRSPRRFLLWVGRAQWPTLLGAALWGMAWMTSLASIPLLLGAGIEAAARRQPDLVLSWSAAILGAGVVAAIAGMMRHRRAVLNYLRAAACTQQLIIRQAARLGGDLPRQVAAGEVASLSATDVDRIGDVFDVFGRFAGSVLTYLAISGVLFWESPEFGLVALLGGPITLAALVIYLRPLGRRQTVQREATAVASGLAVDVVGGLRVLRGLGGESVFQGRFGV
ncbi:MAG: ABC transporter transmembrane domain-containing protein, partial [Candidatus Dormibacteria bacterium]